MRLGPAATTVPVTRLLLLLPLRRRGRRAAPASSRRGEAIVRAAELLLLVRHPLRNLVIARKKGLPVVLHAEVQRELRGALQPERSRPRPSMVGRMGVAAVAPFARPTATATLATSRRSPVLDKLRLVPGVVLSVPPGCTAAGLIPQVALLAAGWCRALLPRVHGAPAVPRAFGVAATGSRTGNARGVFSVPPANCTRGVRPPQPRRLRVIETTQGCGRRRRGSVGPRAPVALFSGPSKITPFLFG